VWRSDNSPAINALVAPGRPDIGNAAPSRTDAERRPSMRTLYREMMSLPQMRHDQAHRDRRPMPADSGLSITGVWSDMTILRLFGAQWPASTSRFHRSRD
jgi:hypothetical protein